MDRLSLLEKQSYITKVFQWLYGDEKQTDYDVIYEHFRKTFIYLGKDVDKLDQEYVFDFEYPPSIKPVGFRLYDGSRFINFMFTDNTSIALEVQDERNKQINRWLSVYKQTQQYDQRYKISLIDKIWGYLFSNSKKQYIFKLVDKNNQNKPGFRAKGHRNCSGQQTGDLSVELLQEIKKMNPNLYTQQIINELFDKNISRSTRCIYVELCLRELNLMFSYDNVFMMKI